MKLPLLKFWPDRVDRAAAVHMALDHSLLDFTIRTGIPVARFYRWSAPAVTVGYFHRFAKGEYEAAHPVPVRRFTGGGLVEHGEDATFVLTLPKDSAPASLAGPDRYRWVHEPLAAALRKAGLDIGLEEGQPEPKSQAGTGPCFVTPATWDLMDAASGAKIAGGAQRRTAGNIIHQGSVRLPEALRDPRSAWIEEFLARLADTVTPLTGNERQMALLMAEILEEEQYGTPEWNRKSYEA